MLRNTREAVDVGALIPPSTLTAQYFQTPLQSQASFEQSLLSKMLASLLRGASVPAEPGICICLRQGTKPYHERYVRTSEQSIRLLNLYLLAAPVSQLMSTIMRIVLLQGVHRWDALLLRKLGRIAWSGAIRSDQTVSRSLPGDAHSLHVWVRWRSSQSQG
jgi:hypothetical protein